MADEYQRTLIVGIYQLMKTIAVASGKQAHVTQNEDIYTIPNYEPIRPEHQWSHIDYSIRAISNAYKEPPTNSAELFLNEQDVQFVKFVTWYRITPDEAFEKWGDLVKTGWTPSN
jgi:hypothetical protein